MWPPPCSHLPTAMHVNTHAWDDTLHVHTLLILSLSDRLNFLRLPSVDFSSTDAIRMMRVPAMHKHVVLGAGRGGAALRSVGARVPGTMMGGGMAMPRFGLSCVGSINFHEDGT